MARYAKRGRDFYARIAPVLAICDILIALMPKPFLVFLLTRVKYLSGLEVRALRERILRRVTSECGSLVDVRDGVHLIGLSGLRVGSRVSIHPMSYIDAEGGVWIGDDVSVAHGVTIMSADHRFSRTDVPIRDQGLEFHSVHIESNVWIGAGARILAGVRIGTGAVVAAGAVVTKDVGPGQVVGGVPARLIHSPPGDILNSHLRE